MTSPLPNTRKLVFQKEPEQLRGKSGSGHGKREYDGRTRRAQLVRVRCRVDHRYRLSPRRKHNDSEDARREEQPRQLSLQRDRDDARHDRNAPRRVILFERLAAEIPTRAQDERDDHRADAVKQAAHEAGAREPLVECGDGNDDRERRQRESDGDRQRAGHAVRHVTAVDAELVSHRPGTCGGDRKSAIVRRLIQPSALLDEIPPHSVGERHGPAEPGCAEHQKIADEIEQGRAHCGSITRITGLPLTFWSGKYTRWVAGSTATTCAFRCKNPCAVRCSRRPATSNTLTTPDSDAT